MQALISTLFIVWRESVEALLVIGILYAWLNKQQLKAQITNLWIGTACGIGLAFCLAVAFFVAGHWFSGSGGDWFFASMMLVASLLILQMIVWMHHHGKTMIHRLEAEAQESIAKSGSLGILLIAMIAVAREGSETVIFLAGVGAQYQGASLSLFILGGFLGFILAIVSFIILNKLASIISWKWYFRISEIFLLLIGGAMMVSAVDKIADQLYAYDLPEWLYAFMGDPVWDTQWLLSNSPMLSSLLAALTGYRAQPSMLEIIALFGYWILALLLCNSLFSQKSKQPTNAS